MLNSNHVKLKSYTELTINELYAIMALRTEVFIVEQNCPYQDLDGNDQHAIHVFILGCRKTSCNGTGDENYSIGGYASGIPSNNEKFIIKYINRVAELESPSRVVELLDSKIVLDRIGGGEIVRIEITEDE